MLIYCWPRVGDDGPTLNQYWFRVSCLLGQHTRWVDSWTPWQPSHNVSSDQITWQNIIQKWLHMIPTGKLKTHSWQMQAWMTIMWCLCFPLHNLVSSDHHTIMTCAIPPDTTANTQQQQPKQNAQQTAQLKDTNKWLSQKIRKTSSRFVIQRCWVCKAGLH